MTSIHSIPPCVCRDIDNFDYLLLHDDSHFSDTIEYIATQVNNTVNQISRGMFTYFPNMHYKILKLWPWIFTITSRNNWTEYIFKMYSDSEMIDFATRYYFPPLAPPERPDWYWNSPPYNVSIGWFFIDSDGRTIIWNPFREKK